MPTYYLEIQVEYDYDYQPAERMTRDYPGCAASVDITQVMVGKKDILEDLDQSTIELLERDAFKEIAASKEDYDEGRAEWLREQMLERNN